MGWPSPGSAIPSTELSGFALLTVSQHLGMAGRSHDHLEDALADAAFADLVVGAHQLQRLALDQRILLLLERRAGLAEALAAGRASTIRARASFDGTDISDSTRSHPDWLACGQCAAAGFSCSSKTNSYPGDRTSLRPTLLA